MSFHDDRKQLAHFTKNTNIDHGSVLKNTCE